MKRLFTAVLINLFAFNYAQTDNRFVESESDVQSKPENSYSDPPPTDPQEEGPGTPGEPVPVNQYWSLLLVAGIGIIIFTAGKNKRKII